MAEDKVWWYAKGDKRFGPYSTSELKGAATAGQIASTDLIWKEGMDNWLTASSVKGLIPVAVPTVPPPLPSEQRGNSTIAKPPASKSQLSQGIRKSASADAPSFWNPIALSNWSFFLLPVFGAYLVTENYKAMGNTTEAKKSMDWLYISIAVILAGWLLVGVSGGFSRTSSMYAFGIFVLAYLTTFLVWNFRSARKQHRYILSVYGKNYARQPWGKVLAIGIAANIGYSFVIRVLF